MNLSNLYEQCVRFASQELLGIAIASTVLCLCGFVSVAFARRQSAASRFWIWQMAGSGILLACLLLIGTSGIPLRSADSVTDESMASVGGIAHAPEHSHLNPFHESLPTEAVSPGNRTHDHETAAPSEAPSSHPLPAMKPDTVKMDRTSIEPTTSTPVASPFFSQRGAVLLVAIWSIVFAINLIWFACCIVCCYRIVALASEIRAPNAVKAFHAACQRTGGDTSIRTAGSRKTKLLTSNRISVPFTIGVLRPKIVLPNTFQSWSSAKLEMVIAHELAHIQRRDVLWHWLNRMACCLAWFNPLVWMAAKQSIVERERACDERVIRSGFAPTDYGQALIEIAAMISGRKKLVGTVSMAEPPLKQRLHWILSPSTNRRHSSIGVRVLVAMLFVVLTGVLGIIRPLAVASSIENPQRTGPSAQDIREADDQVSSEYSDDFAGLETFRMIDSVTGSILTHDDKPVAGASVEFKMYRYVQPHRQVVELKEIGKWETTTDSGGTYTIDTSKLGEIPVDTRLSLARVYHPMMVEGGQMSWSAKVVSDHGKLDPIKLKQGREISGQVFDSDHQPTPAIIRAVGGVANPNLTWFPHAIETDENGKFNLFVPVDYQIELMAIAPAHVVKRIVVPGNEVKPSTRSSGDANTFEELKVINGQAEHKPEPERDTDNDPFDAGKIVLSQGSTVKGQLLDGNDQPIAGVVVGLKTANDTTLHGVAFYANFASVTDDQGRFEFPPATGRSHVFVAKSVYASNRIDSRRVTGKAPPHINPVEIDLDGKSQFRQVTLREITGTQKVSGTIKFDDGRPAAGVEVTAGAVPDVTFGSVLTDENGDYEIELPRPLTNGYLRVMGARDERGVWHSAVGFRSSTGQIGDVHFERLDGDEGEVNWSLRELKTYPFDDSEYTDARKEFIKLQQLAQTLRQQYFEAEKAASTPGEKEKVYMELDPRNAMAKHYLAFEEKHRGKHAAFLAINAGIASAISVARSETEASKGRNEMVSRLLRHYLDHEELATTFDNLDGGPPIPLRDKILEMAMKHSPHRKVRGQALLYRAEFAMKDLRQAEMLPYWRDYLENELADYPQRMREEVQARLDELDAIDQDKHRATALKWLDVIDAEYSDVRVDSEGSHYNRQLSMITVRLRFALNKIIVGEPAPEISVTDVNGTPIQLSQLRGKPVVLTLCFDHGNQLDGQKLATKYADQAVEFVTIVGVNDVEEFTKKYPRDELAGAVATEPLFKGRIRGNWCVNSRTTFLIDEEGILRSHNGSDEATEKWLKSKLQ